MTSNTAKRPDRRPRRGAPKTEIRLVRSSRALPVRALVEVLCAMHLSSYVDSPYEDWGGLVLVGPPGALKSTLLSIVSRAYSEALKVSDINAKTLHELRPKIEAREIRTLVIPELSKLYDRDPRTAANVEGTLKAMVEEGFSAPSFEPQQVARLDAHCVVLTAITPKFQIDNWTRWVASGFARRFLWPLVRMHDAGVIERAIDRWELVDFQVSGVPPLPPQGVIPNRTTPEERRELRGLLKDQEGPHTTQAHSLVKVLAVLRWWYRLQGRPAGEAMRTVRHFARSLGSNGADVVLPRENGL